MTMVQILCARVAVVRTFDGERFAGHVRLTPAGVVLVSREHSLVLTLAGTNISSISFPEESGPAEAEESLFGVLPGAWREADLGNVKNAGSTRVERGRFTVRGAGTTMDTESDSFHYVYVPVQGDHEIVARVTTVQYTDRNAKAGLMMRETMSEYARYVAMTTTAQRGGAFQARYFEARPPEITPQSELRPPYWVKLRRRGQEFSGYKSRNGRQWTLVQQMHVPISDNYYVGLAVASARDSVLNWTTFDKVRMGARLWNEDFLPQIELTSGSIVAGRPSEIMDGELFFGGGRRVVGVPRSRIARILYQPLSAELEWKTRVSRPGVWLQTSDFFEGDLSDLTSDKLRVSSVLYGLRTFDVADEVAALVLGRVTRTRPTVEVDAADGSHLLGTKITFGDGEVLLREPALGQIHLPAYQIRELRIR